MGIGIDGLHLYIGDIFPYGERGIGGEGPGGGSPGEDTHVFIIGVEEELRQVAGDNFEHGDDGGVGHFAVAAGEVELVGAEAGAGGGGVGLDGITFIKEAFVVELAEEPPYGFNVIVFEGDVGVFEIHPIAHFAGDVVPFIFEAHHGFAAFLVVGFHGDGFADILFGDAEFFFDVELYGEAVGIPSAFAFYAFTPEGLVAAEEVFDGAGDDMVDAGFAIGGGWAFIEDEAGGIVALLNTFLEYALCFPKLEDFLINVGEMQVFESRIHGEIQVKFGLQR